MTIEELGVSPLAHGVQTQQYLLEHLLCVELRLLLVKIQIFDFDVVVEFGQDRIILRPHLAEICFLRNAPFGIKAHQEDLDGVDLRRRKIFVAAQNVFQKRNMLCQPRGLAEGARRVHIIRVCVGIPAARFQQIDLIRSLDDVRKTPADCATHLPLLMLHVQRNDRLSRFQEVQKQ